MTAGTIIASGTDDNGQPYLDIQPDDGGPIVRVYLAESRRNIGRAVEKILAEHADDV